MLAKTLDVIERHRWSAGNLVVRVDTLDLSEMEDGVQQRRGMPGAQDEAVAIGPDRILASALSKTDPPVLSKSDPGILS
jgi:hypothetical protein